MKDSLGSWTLSLLSLKRRSVRGWVSGLRKVGPHSQTLWAFQWELIKIKEDRVLFFTPRCLLCLDVYTTDGWPGPVGKFRELALEVCPVLWLLSKCLYWKSVKREKKMNESIGQCWRYLWAEGEAWALLKSRARWRFPYSGPLLLPCPCSLYLGVETHQNQ